MAWGLPFSKKKVMKEITLDTSLSELTVGQLVDIIRLALKVNYGTPAPETVSGIHGIARIFGVSESTAKRIKASGVIDRAISQKGRVIVTNVELARSLWAESTHGRKRISF